MYTTSLRFRKWRYHVLDSLQRTDLPVFVKGHVSAAARSSRTWFYYGSLLFATMYVVSMLQFYSPSVPPSMLEPAYRACRRGRQSGDRLPFLYHSSGRIRKASSVSSRVLYAERYVEDARQDPREARERGTGQREGSVLWESVGPERLGDQKGTGEDARRQEEKGSDYIFAPQLLQLAALATGVSTGSEAGSKLSSSQGAAATDGSRKEGHDNYYHFQGLFVPAVSRPSAHFRSGRGIVITASGRISGQAIGAFVTSFLLRRVLGCELPIEIYFVGEHEIFSTALRDKILELKDVRVSSLLDVLGSDPFYQSKLKHLHVPDRRLRSYAAKPYALYAAPFEEVLLFDAGVIPFANPENFFGLDSFRDHGFHIFRDYRELDRNAWGFVEHEYCTDMDELHGLLAGTEADSSCVLLHKGRAWDALLVTMAMNGPLQPFTYARLNGDKDTWALAAALTYQNFSMAQTTPGYFMREARPELTLLDSAYAGWAQPIRGQVQFRRDPEAVGGVVPLYVNNQLLNMTEYPGMRHRLAFGLWEDYGYPFCGWRAVNALLRPPPQVFSVMDAVGEALHTVGAPDECLCKWFRCRFPVAFGTDSPFLLRRLFS